MYSDKIDEFICDTIRENRPTIRNRNFRIMHDSPGKFFGGRAKGMFRKD